MITPACARCMGRRCSATSRSSTCAACRERRKRAAIVGGAPRARRVVADEADAPVRSRRRVSGLATSWSSAASFRASRRVSPPPRSCARCSRRAGPHGASASRSASSASTPSTARSECSQTSKRCGSGCGGGAHREALRQQDRQDAQPIERAQSRGGRRLGEDADQLVADSLGRHARDQVRRRFDGRLGVRMEPPSRAHREPHAAQRADRIVVDRGGPAGAHHPIAEVVEPARRVHDGGGAVAQQRGHRRGERVHREVAGPQVGLERRRAEIHQIHLSAARPRHDAPGAAVLVQDHEGGVEPVGQAAPQLERPTGHRQVEIGGRATRQQLAQRAAHDPRRLSPGPASSPSAASARRPASGNCCQPDAH